MNSVSPTSLRSVVFDGERAASGPLTFGQRNVLRWVRQQSDRWSSVIPLFLPVPVGTTLDGVTRAIGTLLRRHESLRCTYVTDAADSEPVQVVTGAGELVIEVHEVPGTDPEYVAGLESHLSEPPFNLETDLPVRAAVVTRDGCPVLAVLVFSHMAVDVGSVEVLAREFGKLVAAGANGAAGVPGRLDPPGPLDPPGAQPLDQVVVERSAQGTRRARAALRYWETHLRRAPMCMCAVPADPAADGGHRRVRIHSRAAALALTRIAARTGANQSTAVLAAVASVLGLRTDTRACVFVSISGNRFHPRMRDYVGALAQDALVSFDLDTTSFDEVSRRAWVAKVHAHRNSQFDSTRLWEIIDAVGHERGTYFARDWVFNDVGANSEAGRADIVACDLDELPEALLHTRVEWADADFMPVLLFFRLLRVRDELELELYVDTRYFAPVETERFLRGVERLLVAAAAADVDLADLGRLAGISPIARDAGWVLVDGCWVELTEVQRLLDTALERLPGIGPGRVFALRDAAAGGADAPTLAAYVAVPDPAVPDAAVPDPAVPGAATTTPGELHEACLAELPGRYTAITPRRYVVCAGAPADPASVEAWRQRPVLADGSGRGKAHAIDPEI